jgi:rRNA processing protein Krr1/Pno1
MRGSFANISIARNAISDLILSAPPPGKVYKHMRNIGKRRSERY